MPTNGSVMILNASAENGASSVGLRARPRCLVSGLTPLHRRDVERRRQVVDDRVEQRLHALVLERRAAEHRHDLQRERALADRGADLGLGDRLAARGTSPCSDSSTSATASSSFSRCAVGRVAQVGRESRPRGTSAPRLSSSQMMAFIVDQVDDAAEASPRCRAGAGAATGFAPQALADHARRTRSKSAPTRSILLTKAMRGTRVAVGLAPDRLGLRLDAADRAKTRDRAVEHAQASARPRS